MSYAEDKIILSLKDTLSTVLPKGSQAILFGSRARGDANMESDWDILLLINKKKITASDFDRYVYPLVEKGWSLGQYFSTKMYTYDDWNKRSITPFYKNVMKEGILL